MVVKLNAQCSEVQKYYDENSELEWQRLERHPFEMPLTLYMMEKYIRPGNRVLDVGGGPGRYSIHFAKMGCDVTLVDLSPGNVRFAMDKAAEAGVKFAAHAANCLELDTLNLNEFDHVLLMGPLYHLKEDADRKKAVEQAFEGVKVESVNTMRIKGKVKRQGRTQGRRPERKKAIVTLKKDSKGIEFFEGMADQNA